MDDQKITPPATPTPQNLATQPAPGASPTPANQLPSALSLFSPSIAALSLNIGSYAGLFLAPILIGAFVAFVASVSGGSKFVNIAALVIGLAIVIFFMFILLPAIIYLQIQSVRGKKVSGGTAISESRQYALRMFGLIIVLDVIISIGFLLLIVPGVLLLKRYYLTPFYLIDKNMRIGDAMKASAQATSTYAGAIWGVMGVTFLLGLPAIIPFIGPIFVFIVQVLYGFSPAVRYNEIEKGPIPPPPPPTAVRLTTTKPKPPAF